MNQEKDLLSAVRELVDAHLDLASFLGMKSEDKLATLCGHKAVLLLGRISSEQKSYAMKRQPFSIYYKKFMLLAI